MVAALALGLAGAPPADAAAPAAPAPQGSFTEQVSVEWILVPVLVKWGSRFIRGLGRRSFDLKVDGRQVRFQDFEQRGEVPWSIVFLQDLSGSMGTGGRLDASREAIRYFVDNAKEGDEFALASFAGTTTTIDTPFTNDHDALRETIQGWRAYGKTALNDAVALLPQISGNSRNIKRAVVLITDGADNASQITAAQARALVQRAELPIYVLGLQSGDPYSLSDSGQKLYRYADVLNLLASMTGGKYFPVQGPEDWKEACVSIAEELRYQYVLGFETSGRGSPRYHSIEVSVRRRGFTVKARKGYQGTAPAR
jgi:Ca-activated chloride channel family protein